MKIDCRGHYRKTERHVESHITRELDFEKRMCKTLKLTPEQEIEAISKLKIGGSFPCNLCGEYVYFKTENPGESYTAESECIYKNGFPPIEVKLEVPSGQIILFNDLRRYYAEDHFDFDVNTLAGTKSYSEAYAALGMALHFVGNTCPTVYRISDTRLEIGHGTDHTPEDCDCGSQCKMDLDIGYICTDLWWYCAVDKDEFEKRIGKSVDEFQKEYHATGAWPKLIRADVKPGTYRAVGRYHLDDEILMSYIERIN